MAMVELRLTLGRYKGYLLVSDELSPDTCKFWKINGENSIDKDIFHYDKGKVEDVYHKIVTQIGLRS